MQNRADTILVTVVAWGIFLAILVITLVFFPLREAVPIIIFDVGLFGLGFGLAKMLSRPDRARWVLGVWVIAGFCAIYGGKFLLLRGQQWALMPGSAFLYGHCMAQLPSARSSVENPKPVQNSESSNVLGSDES